MGKDIDISIVVIPAHNEQKTIGEIIRKAGQYCEVLVIDDCSTDDTAALAEKNGAHVIRNIKNIGYTASLNVGIAEAAKIAENIIIMDADGQHDPAQIPEMLKALEDGADFVLGIRHRKARITERFFGIFAKVRAGVHDPLCGFRAFKSAVFNKIGYYDSIGSIGTQFVFNAKKNGFSIKEIDVDINKRQDEPRLFGGNNLRAEIMMAKAFVKLVAFDLLGIRLVDPKWK